MAILIEIADAPVKEFPPRRPLWSRLNLRAARFLDPNRLRSTEYDRDLWLHRWERVCSSTKLLLKMLGASEICRNTLRPSEDGHEVVARNAREVDRLVA
jgi:hypothetical protein